MMAFLQLFLIMLSLQIPPRSTSDGLRTRIEIAFLGSWKQRKMGLMQVKLDFSLFLAIFDDFQSFAAVPKERASL